MASIVVPQINMAELASKSGGGWGPFTVACRLGRLGAPVFESIEVEESFASPCRRRSRAFVDARGDVRLMFGSTRRFCFEGGNISSRSTGTPSETRNSLRILLRVQFGGCIGGGCTSCCHSESDLSDKKGELLDMSNGGIDEGGGVELGKMASRYGVVSSSTSAADRSSLRSKGGCQGVSARQRARNDVR